MRRLLLSCLLLAGVCAVGVPVPAGAGEGTIDPCPAVPPAQLALGSFPDDLHPDAFVSLPLADSPQVPNLALFRLTGPSLHGRVAVMAYRLDSPGGGGPSHTDRPLPVTVGRASFAGVLGPDGIQGAIVTRPRTNAVQVVLARHWSHSEFTQFINMMSTGPAAADTPLRPSAPAELRAHLESSHVPGFGSLALSPLSLGWVRSYTNNPNEDQRAIAFGVVRSCQDSNPLRVLLWWYGSLARMEPFDGGQRLVALLPPHDGLGRSNRLFWDDDQHLFALGGFGVGRSAVADSAASIEPDDQ